MLAYYFELAIKALRRNWANSAMLALTIGLGIGASTTMISVVSVMTRDPAPMLSQYLYYPALAASPPGWEGNDSEAMTWVDAQNLIHGNQADDQAAMAGGRALVTPNGPNQSPFYTTGHLVTAQFFPMFSPPFRAGGGWRAADDEQSGRLVVLNGELAEKLFGQANPVGQTVRLDHIDYRVVGVLDSWHPEPLFYGGLSGDFAFGGSDEYFVPLRTALDNKMRVLGGMSCWGKDADSRRGEHCAWLQFWVRLNSSASKARYLAYLQSYWLDQRHQGRLVSVSSPRLERLMERLATLHVVPDDVKRQLFLAQLFLLVCVMNAVGLLLSRFLQMSHQLSLRRALGARWHDIMLQLISEAVVAGVIGGILGCVFAALGLAIIRSQPDRYAQLAHYDARTVAVAITLSFIASLFAAVVPAWKAAKLAPAVELKLQ